MIHASKLITLVAALLLTISACSESSQQTAPPPPIPTTSEVAAPETSTPQDSTNEADEGSDQGVLTSFSANGNSPAWSAEVKDDSITLEVPDFMTPDSAKHTITATRSAYAKGVNFDGKDGDVDFTLDIRSVECIKTGNKREFTATLTYGKNTYHGCADALK